MEDQLARIETKLDKTQDLVFQIGKDLSALTAQLEALGRRVSGAEAELSDVKRDQEPLKRHVAMWSGAAKVLGVLGALTGLAAAVRQLFQ